MKLPTLLAQYLFTYNELNLAGIGRFQLEQSEREEETLEKNSKTGSIVISFLQDVSVKEDDKLIAFITAHSGKMKSLASSDLESYLEQAKEFMNIGKPFLIEGIGTLTKMKPGKFDFIQAISINDKIKEHTAKETEQTPEHDETSNDFSEIFSPKKPQTPASKKIILLLAILAGTGLAVWGGFILYKKYYSPKKPSIESSLPIILKDTSSITKIDTSINTLKDSSSATTFYKFIIEQADSLRAFTRYNYLKKWGINIEMETTDSIIFKLYFHLSTFPADTTRIKDSLTRLYGTKEKTFIE